jgi:hypothetical protein
LGFVSDFSFLVETFYRNGMKRKWWRVEWGGIGFMGVMLSGFVRGVRGVLWEW